MKAMNQAVDHIVKYYGKESKVKYKTYIQSGEEFVKGISRDVGIEGEYVRDSKGNKRYKYSRVQYEYVPIFMWSKMGYVEISGVGSKKYTDAEGKKT